MIYYDIAYTYKYIILSLYKLRFSIIFEIALFITLKIVYLPFTNIQIKKIDEMNDGSQDQGKQLFEQEFGQDQKKSYKQEDVSRQQKGGKRLKKNKKDKNAKKKSRRYEQQEEQEDQRGEMDSMFEDQASEGSDEEDDLDQEAELGYYEQKKKFQQLYARKQNGSDAILKRIAGKSQKEINQMYKRKLHQRRQNQVLFPSSQDHQTYSVQCKMGKQDQVVFSILKKTEHYKKTKNDKFKIEITSAMAMKKKYPGKVFIQAEDQKTIRQGLQGLIDVNIKRIIKLEHQDYTNLFMVKEVEQAQFRENSYIRIKKGVYEDDLGKIVKLKKNNADVLLVPRVNVQEILIKIKQFTSKMTDQKAIQQKTQEILRRFVNPRTHYPQNMRPAKKFFDNQDPFGDIDVPFASRIHIQKGGLIVLNFRLDEFKKIQQGSVLPAQMAPFAQNGQTFEQMKQQKVATIINFEKGQQAEIIAGQLAGYFGTVEQIKTNTAVIKCRTKGMEGQLLQEPLDHLAKRFKQGQRVKVNSGADKGKTGIILKLDGKYADIWTDNENTIKINKNNLELYMGEVINQENVHNLRKDDLIKTSKNVVGIVLSTTKDNIKILDMNNTIQIVNNLDFDSKINSGVLLTKNKNNQQIRNNSIIRIRQGPHQGLRCVAKHVYKDFVFLFNQQLDKTSGITVEKADNCAVLAKTSQGMKVFAPKSSIKPGFNQREGGQDDQFKVGKSIVISSGPLKGYRGVIKSINKDRIEVRVPQKSQTEWINRSNLASSANRDRMEMGKTPNRMAMSTHQVAGMSPGYHYN